MSLIHIKDYFEMKARKVQEAEQSDKADKLQKIKDNKEKIAEHKTNLVKAKEELDAADRAGDDKKLRVAQLTVKQLRGAIEALSAQSELIKITLGDEGESDSNESLNEDTIFSQSDHLKLKELIEQILNANFDKPVRWTYNILYSTSNTTGVGGYETNNKRFAKKIEKTIGDDVKSISKELKINPKDIRFDIDVTEGSSDIRLLITPTIINKSKLADYKEWWNDKFNTSGAAARSAGPLD